MNINKNNAYIITCAFLDAAKHSVDFTCTMMRVALVAHGHKDGYDGWIEQEAGHHLTGDEKLPAIDDRARRLLARFAGGDPEIGIMPGFEPAETDARLKHLAP